MLMRLEDAAVASDGAVAIAGRLADNLESRGAGAGGLVGGCTVVFGGRRVDRERGGWVGVVGAVVRVG
ncbi:hypothetical protein [Nocardia sp. NPDC049526]|uniref:hypothetical protein n=1 Tax=Nocardia sp. NPDC049526 TaxID=3364316 RepID=UPI0037AAC42F